MIRQDIIDRAMTKLGMIGDPEDPISTQDKEDLLKTFWNEKEPRVIIKKLQDFFNEEKKSKEAKQDLLKFFKLKGLFKRSDRNNHDNTKAWRLIVKEHVPGFMLGVL